MERIPELYAYGTNAMGIRTARPSFVFEKIERSFTDETLRRDALRMKARGLASNYLYDFLANSPNASYREQKEALQ